jgi:hypothetical protein
VSSSGRPGPLHHAVKRQVIRHDYLSHLISCPFGLGSATQMRRLGIPETRVIPASHSRHERDRPKSTPVPYHASVSSLVASDEPLAVSEAVLHEYQCRTVMR